MQLPIHLADSAAGAAYSFTVTCIILFVMSTLGRWIPCLRLRATKEEEAAGIDDVEIGEFAHDYIELIREVKPQEASIAEPPYDEEDEVSQRSHSQAQMFHPPPDKGLGHTNTYQMQTFGRNPMNERNIGAAS